MSKSKNSSQMSQRERLLDLAQGKPKSKSSSKHKAGSSATARPGRNPKLQKPDAKGKGRPRKTYSGNSQDASGSPAPSDDMAAENERLRARIAEYERKLSEEGKIVEILKPKGEAGRGGTRGYNLQSAMKLNTPEGNILYNTIVNSVHDAVATAKINKATPYKQINPEQTAKVTRLIRKAHPYMTTDRFPGNWPTLDILKGYLQNVRRGRNKAAKVVSQILDSLPTADEKSNDSDGAADDSVEDDDKPMKRKRRLRKRSPEPELSERKDDEDEDEDGLVLRKRARRETVALTNITNTQGIKSTKRRRVLVKTEDSDEDEDSENPAGDVATIFPLSQYRPWEKKLSDELFPENDIEDDIDHSNPEKPGSSSKSRLA
ncbi:hypothetical protein D9611_012864 [Ephemerocybe angulata]|uniref:Uncharacterized protein n=1 Tax=Ephemerocybe angulata TaxID=980116 RepID=A0A8H5BAS5_9AGAR|nr:hypothetical protein D9611_012864 [Tulosesus angulatus]